MSITVNAVNDAPVAVNDSYAVDQNKTLSIAAKGVLTNDSDVDADILKATLVTPVSNGTLVLTEDGAFTYTPNTNYSGVDSFIYKVNDGYLESQATVSITIRGTSPDVTRPKVTIISPKNNSLALTDVVVQATDNVAVERVECFIDRQLIGTIYGDLVLYTFSLDTTKISRGRHYLIAIAVDTSKNVAQQTIIIYK